MSISRRKVIKAIALGVPALKFMPAYALSPVSQKIIPRWPV